jgi:hypothetical protein
LKLLILNATCSPPAETMRDISTRVQKKTMTDEEGKGENSKENELVSIISFCRKGNLPCKMICNGRQPIFL